MDLSTRTDFILWRRLSGRSGISFLRDFLIRYTKLRFEYVCVWADYSIV